MKHSPFVFAIKCVSMLALISVLQQLFVRYSFATNNVFFTIFASPGKRRKMSRKMSPQMRTSEDFIDYASAPRYLR